MTVLESAHADVLPAHSQPARKEINEIKSVPGSLGKPEDGVGSGVFRKGEVGLFLHNEVRGCDLELHQRGA